MSEADASGEPGGDQHPHGTEAYARALSGSLAEPCFVPAWNSHVLIRENAAGLRTASGVYPYTPIDPNSDLAAGIETLRQQKVASISLVTDPIWCPPPTALADAFDICRPLKHAWVIDRDAEGVRFRKKHRNRINRSQRVCEARIVALADHVETAWEMYSQFAEEGRISGGMTLAEDAFETLATLPGATTVAAFADEQPIAISVWTRFRDMAYFLIGLSNEAGYAASASYAYHAVAIEHFADCRRIILGPEVGLRDTDEYAATGFKAGFCNATFPVHMCAKKLGGGSA